MRSHSSTFSLFLSTALIVATLFNTACSSFAAAPKRDFNPTKPVQAIAMSGHTYIFAQENVLLDGDSLDGKLQALNTDYDRRIRKARRAENIATAALIGQLASLMICVGQEHLSNTLAWCGGSVALAFALVFPMSARSMSLRNGVVGDYNQSLR